LDYPEDSVDEIRASHVLEHFSHREVGDVLNDWHRVLKPGGRLRVAVPDFEWIARNYIEGKDVNVQGYTMGGHVDDDDRHGCLFDKGSLTRELEQTGFEVIGDWVGDMEDCSTLPVSLNISAVKRNGQAVQPKANTLNIVAIMSMPRLGFADNFTCIYKALAPLKIPFRTVTGAYWAQCMERGIEDAIEETQADVILTLDYDTVFTSQDVSDMRHIMQSKPIDALSAVQVNRGSGLMLMTKKGDDGKNMARMPVDIFENDVTPINSSHFGLTMLRVESLKKLKKPWFLSQPGADGCWSKDRVDDDMYFWREFGAQGFKLYQANRVVAGHLQLMACWPGKDGRAVSQHRSDYVEKGKPKGIWE
jgi:hypothetical protein